MRSSRGALGVVTDTHAAIDSCLQHRFIQTQTEGLQKCSLIAGRHIAFNRVRKKISLFKEASRWFKVKMVKKKFPL